MTAQLINAQDGYHLWSERFADRELADVFAIRIEIAQAIAGSLQLKLVGTRGLIARIRPSCPPMMPLLRGRHHLFKISPETWTRAKGCFEHAIAIDPAYADAHAYLSLGYFFMGMNGILPLRDVAHLVRAEAQKAPRSQAVERLGRAFCWAGSPLHMTMTGRWRPTTSMPRWRQPGGPERPMGVCQHFIRDPLGRFQDSVASMRLEVEQDPLEHLVALHLRQPSATRGECMPKPSRKRREGLWTWMRTSGWPHYNLAEIYVATGQFAEAVAAGERAYRSAHLELHWPLVFWRPRSCESESGTVHRP